MADAISNTRASKPQAKLLDCLMGDDLNILDENENINSDIEITKFETPVNHTFFGPAKAFTLKKGTVIKVVFESETNINSTVKINFYKSGSNVIQGQQCIQFSDRYI